MNVQSTYSLEHLLALASEKPIVAVNIVISSDYAVSKYLKHLLHTICYFLRKIIVHLKIFLVNVKKSVIPAAWLKFTKEILNTAQKNEVFHEGFLQFFRSVKGKVIFCSVKQSSITIRDS